MIVSFICTVTPPFNLHVTLPFKLDMILPFNLNVTLTFNSVYMLGDPEVTAQLYCNFAVLEGCVICSIYLR